ncbi:MarR family winged helix-turn-helix transcriptional regulator [Bauldia sp.]|uniref:MarR family winged helix-turn-helix transcriptional regulator n=1 Tax=Bauldia sp. TaxID=2575872 RepID=UPI003BAAE0F8
MIERYTDMARLFAHGLQRRIAPLGLAPAQFMTLLVLWAEDGLTQKELINRLDIEQATMANTLNRMERDGLIRLKPHPNDARSQQVWLRALRKPATEAAEAQNQAALSTLSEAEQTEFIALMTRVIATMRAQR